jgi:uncharacterized protein
MATRAEMTNDAANVTTANVEDGHGGAVPLTTRLGLMALRFYKAYLSVLFAGQCRFVPSCSQYSYEAVERFGLARGSWMTLERLLRCHPFSRKFGYDPVPDCCGDERDAPHRHSVAGSFEGHS